jgi:tetratricopeptide (TPR) repeat protein
MLAPVIGGVTLAVFMMPGCVGGARGVAADESQPQASPRVNAMTYFAHGHLLERQGNFARAAEQYQEAIGRQPSMVGARNRLGITLNKLGRHAEASEEFRKAIAINGNLAHLHNNLGFSLLLEGKHFLAEKHLRQAAEMNPDFKRARMNHGIAMAKLGQLDAAFEEFSAICSRADAYYNVAMLHADAGHYASACAALRQALAEDPDMTAAELQLEQLASLAEQEQKRQAEAAAARAAVLEVRQAAQALSEPQPVESVEESPEADEQFVEVLDEFAPMETWYESTCDFFDTPVKLNGIIDDDGFGWETDVDSDAGFGEWYAASDAGESTDGHMIIMEEAPGEWWSAPGFRPAEPTDQYMTAADESPLMTLRAVRPQIAPEPIGTSGQLRAAIEDLLARNEMIVQLFLAVQGWIEPDVAFEVADDVAEVVQDGLDQVWTLEQIECRQLDQESADAAENNAAAPVLTSERPNR